MEDLRNAQTSFPPDDYLAKKNPEVKTHPRVDYTPPPIDPTLKKHMDKASEFEKEGKLEEAISEYSSAIQFNDTWASAFAGRGGIHLMRKEYAKALADFEEVLKLTPNSVLAMGAVAHCLTALGEYDRALQKYDECLYVDDRFAFALGERGQVHLLLGNADQAKKDFEALLRILPRSGKAWMGMTKVALMSGKVPAAKIAAENAVKHLNDVLSGGKFGHPSEESEILRDLVEAHLHLAALAQVPEEDLAMRPGQQRSDPKKHLDLALEATQKAKMDTSPVRLQLAMYFYRMGQFEKALEECNQILPDGSVDPPPDSEFGSTDSFYLVYLIRGQCYWRVFRYADCIRDLELFLQKEEEMQEWKEERSGEMSEAERKRQREESEIQRKQVMRLIEESKKSMKQISSFSKRY